MSYDIEEKQRRLLKVDARDVVVQALIGGEFEVASKSIRQCHLCGGSVLRSAAGEYLSPNKLVVDKDGAYGTPHRHRKTR